MRKMILLATIAAAVSGCTMQHKIAGLRDGSVSAGLNISQEADIPELAVDEPVRDTMTVTGLDGKEVLIMNAVKDENGEMVATDVIRPAMVSARFRNVAERQGKVDICFDVSVPKEMMDGKWQLRIYPRMKVFEDIEDLDPVLITGSAYRKFQLRGYEQYDKFLRSIAADSTRFVDIRQLEIFLKRNIPQIYRFKEDSTFVSDEEFSSAFGVTESEAIDHYTNEFLIRRNERKIGMKDKMFRRYVPSPIVDSGLKLDTVIRSGSQDFIYRYVQSLTVPPRLKKVDISMEGGIFEQEKQVYDMPKSDSLTFYISSLSSFADNTERYLTEVISRKVEANTACYIDFEAGKSDIKESLSHNREEIGRIKQNLASLADNMVFDLDSITITASCSPEGRYPVNEQLSSRRSKSVSDYFSAFIKEHKDSVAREYGSGIDLDGTYRQEKSLPIRFISRSNPENWKMLDVIVRKDSVMTAEDKGSYDEVRKIQDPDSRESAMQRKAWYRYVREAIYPRLRTVQFDMYLHRKGMVQDTVHTTRIDSVYMAGVMALKDRDYASAVKILRPYEDFNSAVAFVAMDMNTSAMTVLERLDGSAKVEYLKALVFSRTGKDRDAVECYLAACRMDRSFISRGNLDPEISSLISRYDLQLY